MSTKLVKKVVNRHNGKTLGIEEILQYLERNYNWPKMKKNIQNYIHLRENCQRTKYSRRNPYGTLALTETHSF